jgi:hypothetical protein
MLLIAEVFSVAESRVSVGSSVSEARQDPWFMFGFLLVE